MCPSRESGDPSEVNKAKLTNNDLCAQTRKQLLFATEIFFNATMLTPYSLDQASVKLETFRLLAAQLIVPVSIAKIQGHQSPEATANVFTETFVHFAPKPTVDAGTVDTGHLYANESSLTAYEWRQRTLKYCMWFRREFDKQILKAANDNPLIIPHAYTHYAWDQLILDTPAFKQTRSLLRNAYHSKRGFRDAVNRDIARTGRNPTPDKIAFIIEEHALTFCLWIGETKLNRPMTKSFHEIEQRIIAYPGEITESLILAARILLGKNAAETNKWFWADTSKKPMRLYNIGTLLSAQNN